MLPSTDNFYSAYMAFHEMGFETKFFHSLDEVDDSHPEDILVGYVGTCKWQLKRLGVDYQDMDYPEELTKYLGRKIWKSTINTINTHPELWPVFVKSTKNKMITGKVITCPKDLIGCGAYDGDQDVYCSEVVNFVAEWRVFVRYGQILGVSQYKGHWKYHYDSDVIAQCVKDFKSAPAGYALDFGLTDKGETLLIEFNDGYALGSYGLLYYHYGKLLAARWAELTGTVDECKFDVLL
jgi:hypothetical protein